MDYQGEFSGRIEINGQLEADGVHVFLTEDTVVFRKSNDQSNFRKRLYVHPFNKFMLFTQDPQKMREGYFYELRGTDVGMFIEGSVGYPSGDDTDTRRVQYVRLDVSYSADRIQATISGTTASGTSTSRVAKALEPWSFVVDFEIPRAEVRTFFKLNEFVWNNVNELFEKHCGIA